MDISNGLRISPKPQRENFDQITNYYDSKGVQKRYFQPDKNSISNDWASVVDNQVHDARLKKAKEQSLRKSMQSNYYADLDLIKSIKEETKLVEVDEKNDEKNYMDQAAQLMNSEQAELNKEEKQFK